MARKDVFLREYIKAIRDGNAAVFAGAGLSRSSGYVTWKDLVRPYAEEVGLNIEEEHDYPAITQYYVNKVGNRGSINADIIEAFDKDVEINENVRILTRLPIYTYWTTNYDHLIEEGLQEANRKPDVKMEYRQLSTTKRDRDAVVYKMHGDVDHSSDAVLTKDDYAKYDKSHPFFRRVLQGDLLSKTFLFIGFSFEDPNLDFILSQIRLLLDDSIRNHFCIMKRVSKKDFADDEVYGYRCAQQDCHEADLARYGIQTVYVDDYKEITDLLRKIEAAVKTNSVFISGSASVYTPEWPEEKVAALAYGLSNKLVKENFKITSGYGFGIGSSVINGALKEIFTSKYKHIDEHLGLFPFPQNIRDGAEREKQFEEYRKNIIDENGVIVFLFGNKKDLCDNTIISDGCMQEYAIAKEKGKTIIPIGSTGWAAREILSDMEMHISDYPYLEPHIAELKSENDIDKLIDIVVKISKERRIIH